MTDNDTSNAAATADATATADASPVSNDERTWSVLTHIGTLFLSVLPPLIVLLITQSEEVKAHAKEDINLSISFLIYFMILGMLTVASGSLLGLITIPIYMVLSIMYIVMLIVAAVKASNNELFRHKMIFRLIK